jgi:hypothetical protein
LHLAKNQPLPKLGRQFADGFAAIFADGSPRFLGKTVPSQLIHSVITSRNGEFVTPDQFGPDPKPGAE